MRDVDTRLQPGLRYHSRESRLRADEIDSFVVDTVRALRADHVAAGPPFSLYRGCSKDDEQLVEVCLPSADGEHELPDQELAFTVVEGAECDYPQILGAYDAVTAYAAAQGRELAGQPLEIYLRDPDAPSPLMEIAFPLVPATRS